LNTTSVFASYIVAGSSKVAETESIVVMVSNHLRVGGGTGAPLTGTPFSITNSVSPNILLLAAAASLTQNAITSPGDDIVIEGTVIVARSSFILLKAAVTILLTTATTFFIYVATSAAVGLGAVDEGSGFIMLINFPQFDAYFSASAFSSLVGMASFIFNIKAGPYFFISNFATLSSKKVLIASGVAGTLLIASYTSAAMAVF
jgi:hypothetical protein